jgi:hypothetical protein
MDWALNPKLPSSHRSGASIPLSSLTSTTLLNLTGHITREDDFYSAHGGFADIYVGTWLNDTEKRKVCLEFILIRLIYVPKRHRPRLPLKWFA